MKAVRLREVKELLESQNFTAWWAEYREVLTALQRLRVRHEDLVREAETMDLRSDVVQRAAIEAFSRSGGEEERGRAEAAEAQSLENSALQHVALYEEHRFKTSDRWYRLGGVEKDLEERREALSALGDGGKARAQAEAAFKEAERDYARAQEEYDAADRQRDALWDEVEQAWSRSFERALLSSEHRVSAKTVRRQAEKLFKEAEERRLRGKQLRVAAETVGHEHADLEGRRAALLKAAEQKFGCMAGEGFLYFRKRDDNRSAFAVALRDLPEGTHLQVKALGIYTAGLKRGIEFLEPSHDEEPLTATEPEAGFEGHPAGTRKGGRPATS